MKRLLLSTLAIVPRCERVRALGPAPRHHRRAAPITLPVATPPAVAAADDRRRRQGANHRACPATDGTAAAKPTGAQEITVNALQGGQTA